MLTRYVLENIIRLTAFERNRKTKNTSDYDTNIRRCIDSAYCRSFSLRGCETSLFTERTNRIPAFLTIHTEAAMPHFCKHFPVYLLACKHPGQFKIKDRRIVVHTAGGDAALRRRFCSKRFISGSMAWSAAELPALRRSRGRPRIGPLLRCSPSCHAGGPDRPRHAPKQVIYWSGCNLKKLPQGIITGFSSAVRPHKDISRRPLQHSGFPLCRRWGLSGKCLQPFSDCCRRHGPHCRMQSQQGLRGLYHR